MQSVAIQTFQNTIALQLAAMIGQLSVPNQAIAHSGGYSKFCQGNCSHIRCDQCCYRCNTSHDLTPSYCAATGNRRKASNSGLTQSTQGNLRPKPLWRHQYGLTKPGVNPNIKKQHVTPAFAHALHSHIQLVCLALQARRLTIRSWTAIRNPKHLPHIALT